LNNKTTDSINRALTETSKIINTGGSKAKAMQDLGITKGLEKTKAAVQQIADTKTATTNYQNSLNANGMTTAQLQQLSKTITEPGPMPTMGMFGDPIQYQNDLKNWVAQKNMYEQAQAAANLAPAYGTKEYALQQQQALATQSSIPTGQPSNYIPTNPNYDKRQYQGVEYAIKNPNQEIWKAQNPTYQQQLQKKQYGDYVLKTAEAKAKAEMQALEDAHARQYNDYQINAALQKYYDSKYNFSADSLAGMIERPDDNYSSYQSKY